MISAALRTLISVAGGLLDILGAVWASAGREVAAAAAVALACVTLVQCGEIGALQKAHGKLVDEREGLAARLATCRASADVLQAALDDQSARVRAMGDESARRIAEADQAVQRAAQGRQEAERRAAAAIAASRGPAPVCERLLALDALILEQAQ